MVVLGKGDGCIRKWIMVEVSCRGCSSHKGMMAYKKWKCSFLKATGQHFLHAAISIPLLPPKLVSLPPPVFLLASSLLSPLL